MRFILEERFILTEEETKPAGNTPDTTAEKPADGDASKEQAANTDTDTANAQEQNQAQPEQKTNRSSPYP